MSVRLIFYVGEPFAEVQGCVESMREQMVLLGWIPTKPFARVRQDALGLLGKGEYMIMHNLHTCWEEQASPHSIQGGCAVHVFSWALTAGGASLSDSVEGAWLALCCCLIPCRAVDLVLINLRVQGTLEQSGRICLGE